jgi:hypothetical protein
MDLCHPFVFCGGRYGKQIFSANLAGTNSYQKFFVVSPSRPWLWPNSRTGSCPYYLLVSPFAMFHSEGVLRHYK